MRKWICLVVVMAVLSTGCLAQTAPVRRSVVGFYFDTVVTLAAYVNDDSVLKAALSECEKYEKLLSKTIQGSDVWNINHANGKTVTVSDDTALILQTAIDVAKMSDGALDITVAPVVALWDFVSGEKILPDASSMEQAISYVGYEQIALSGNEVTVPSHVQIDLGAIAKGYIADCMAAFFRAHGVESGIVNLGGNVITIGKKAEGDVAWSVGIQDPEQPTGQPLLAVEAVDLSVVTSGIYERGFDLDGVRYHHLLDPKTGYPAQNELASVTIFSDSSMMGDALSTAIFVSGLEKGRAMVDSMPGIEALFITRSGEIVPTEGAQNHMVL